MPLEPLENTAFDLLPTADVAEMAGRLWVRQDFLPEGIPIVPGTTIEDFLAERSIDKSPALTQGFGLYQLTKEPAVQRQGGFLGFTFAKPKTEDETLTPFNEETIWDNDFAWPPVLQVLIGMAGYVKNIETEVGTDGVGATANAKARLEARERLFLLPGIRVPTEVTVREYQSPVAFTPSQFSCDPPVPTLVSFSYLGAQFSQVCLHPRVIVPEQMTDAVQIEGLGTVNPKGIDWSKGQIFKETNQTDWQSHIYRIDTGRHSSGIYFLKTYEAHPPEAPAPIPL
jgi:hypothetical protein